MRRCVVQTGVLVAVAALGLSVVAAAGSDRSRSRLGGPLPAPERTIERLSGVWVEGPGYNVSYGGNYDQCALKCLSAEKCVMIEYYRPERKCNLYDKIRPRKSGGSSDVAIVRAR